MERQSLQGSVVDLAVLILLGALSFKGRMNETVTAVLLGFFLYGRSSVGTQKTLLRMVPAVLQAYLTGVGGSGGDGGDGGGSGGGGGIGSGRRRAAMPQGGGSGGGSGDSGPPSARFSLRALRAHSGAVYAVGSAVDTVTAFGGLRVAGVTTLAILVLGMRC